MIKTTTFLDRSLAGAGYAATSDAIDVASQLSKLAQSISLDAARRIPIHNDPFRVAVTQDVFTGRDHPSLDHCEEFVRACIYSRRMECSIQTVSGMGVPNNTVELTIKFYRWAQKRCCTWSMCFLGHLRITQFNIELY